MASHRKKAAKQSLKQRRTKTECRRFERMRSGKTYGGTWIPIVSRCFARMVVQTQADLDPEWIIQTLAFQ